MYATPSFLIGRQNDKRFNRKYNKVHAGVITRELMVKPEEVQVVDNGLTPHDDPAWFQRVESTLLSSHWFQMSTCTSRGVRGFSGTRCSVGHGELGTMAYLQHCAMYRVLRDIQSLCPTEHRVPLNPRIPLLPLRRGQALRHQEGGVHARGAGGGAGASSTPA